MRSPTLELRNTWWWNIVTHSFDLNMRTEVSGLSEHDLLNDNQSIHLDTLFTLYVHVQPTTTELSSTMQGYHT